MRYMSIISGFKDEHRWLSNFWIHDSVRQLSVEHHYQAAKTTNYEDWLLVMAAPTAGQAKKLGKLVTIRPDWEDIKFIIMEQFTREKYATNRSLREKLIETRGSLLIEENHWGDTVWGVCNGVGENRLGKILMKVRDEFL